MQGLPSILSFFRNEFDKFNNVRMLGSIYHMTLKILKNPIFGVKNVKIFSSFTQRYNGCHYATLLNLYRFYCIVLYHSQMRLHMIYKFSNKKGINKS